MDDDRKKKLSEDTIAEIRAWRKFAQEEPEAYGSRGDHVLCDLLEALGFGEVVEEYWKHPDKPKPGGAVVRQ
jgi:hypothetical protein